MQNFQDIIFIWTQIFGDLQICISVPLNLNIGNCYYVSITFSMEEGDLLSASIRSWANFNVYPRFSRIKDRAASLRDFCTASTKRLLAQRLLHKYKSRASDT